MRCLKEHQTVDDYSSLFHNIEKSFTDLHLPHFSGEVQHHRLVLLKRIRLEKKDNGIDD